MTTELNTNITTFMQPISVKWKACSIFNHTCRTCKLQFVAEIKFYIRIHTWHNYCIFKIKNSQSGEILKTLIPFYITVKQISIDLLMSWTRITQWERWFFLFIRFIWVIWLLHLWFPTFRFIRTNISVIGLGE